MPPAIAPHVRAAIKATVQPKVEPGGVGLRPLAPHVQAAIGPAIQPRLAVPKPPPVGPRNGAQAIQRYEGHAHYPTAVVFRGPTARSVDATYFRWDVPEFVDDLRWRQMTIELAQKSGLVYRLEVYLHDGGWAERPYLTCLVELRGPLKASPTLNYVRTGYACLDLTGRSGGDLKIYADPGTGGREIDMRAVGIHESIAKITEIEFEGRFVLSKPNREESYGGRLYFAEFDLSEIIPRNTAGLPYPQWSRIRAAFLEDNGSIRARVFLEHNGTVHAEVGGMIRPGRIKAHPLLNYVRKGLAAVDVMDAHGGEIKIGVAPIGVSPDTMVRITVRGQLLVSTVIEPVMEGQFHAVPLAEKAKMAIQYALEAGAEGTMPHAKTEAEREEELGRQFKRVEDFIQRPGDVLDYIWQILKDKPKAEMTERGFKSLVKFSWKVTRAKDVDDLREAGKTLAAEAIDVVKLVLPK